MGVLPVTKKDKAVVLAQIKNVTAWIPHLTWNKKNNGNGGDKQLNHIL